MYVVNATCKEDVKKGVDFAREYNVRLIVKGTGHGYIGRRGAFYLAIKLISLMHNLPRPVTIRYLK